MYQRFWGVYLGVKTCEVFHSFLATIFLGSIVSTSQWLLCIHCFTSLVSFTDFYTGDEPSRLLDGRQFVTELNITKFSLALILGARYAAFDRGVRSRFFFFVPLGFLFQVYVPVSASLLCSFFLGFSLSLNYRFINNFDTKSQIICQLLLNIIEL